MNTESGTIIPPPADLRLPGNAGRIGVRIGQAVPGYIRDYVGEFGKDEFCPEPPPPLIVHTVPGWPTLFITHRDDLGFQTEQLVEVGYDTIDDLVTALLALKKHMDRDGPPDDGPDAGDWVDDVAAGQAGVPA